MTIVVEGLTKKYGSKVVVSDLSFEVKPGVVTGFLGPNGAGKSTTMRCMLGLDRPESGTATFGGKPYRSLANPLHEVGSLLDASYVHPARTARNHLRWLAASNGISPKRADVVLEQVGLSSASGKSLRTFSLGMKQRLGLAGVLLGDPHTMILDEPGNGLDPEGIRWVRDVLVLLASQGRTVLVSSHLLAEMSLMATSLVVIGRGQLVSVSTVDQFVATYGDRFVSVTSPRIAELAQALTAQGAKVEPAGPTSASVRGIDAPTIGETAARLGIALHALTDQTGSLEESFLKATSDVREYQAGAS
jgi:ABC-2 type transport system ATP-binding protein